MSRMTQNDWTVYGLLRATISKAAAEKYRHDLNAKYAKYGIRTPSNISEWTLVRDYGMDGMLLKQFIPREMSAKDRECFEESHWIEIPFSPYDCTGRFFSNWMSFFTVPGGTWVYHSIGIDV